MTHTAAHSDIISVTHPSTSQHTDEYISCSYQSEQTLKDHILSSLLQQGTVFEAVRLAREVNKLNGYKVVSDYDIREIKCAYRNTYEEGLKVNSDGDIKSGKSRGNDKMRQLQKAYMKMLSL